MEFVKKGFKLRTYFMTFSGIFLSESQITCRQNKFGQIKEWEVSVDEKRKRETDMIQL